MRHQFAAIIEQYNYEEGFTLIELLVVILIIGTLTSVAFPIFLNQRYEAADAALKVDMKQYSLQLEESRIKNKNNIVISQPLSISDSGATVIAIHTEFSEYCIFAVGQLGEVYTYDSLSAGFTKEGCTHPEPNGTTLPYSAETVKQCYRDLINSTLILRSTPPDAYHRAVFFKTESFGLAALNAASNKEWTERNRALELKCLNNQPNMTVYGLSMLERMNKGIAEKTASDARFSKAMTFESSINRGMSAENLVESVYYYQVIDQILEKIPTTF